MKIQKPLTNPDVIKFKKFLGKENYEKWKHEFYYICYSDNPESFLEGTHPNNYISHWLIWNVENKSFWLELQKEWLNIYNK
jgi:hypothetical protein